LGGVEGFLAASLEEVGGQRGDRQWVVVRWGGEVAGCHLGRGWPVGGAGVVELLRTEKKRRRSEEDKGEAEAVAREK
jgi:hypothetical protein